MEKRYIVPLVGMLYIEWAKTESCLRGGLSFREVYSLGEVFLFLSPP